MATDANSSLPTLRLIARVRLGDQEAKADLLARTYGQLRAMAKKRRRFWDSAQATDLANDTALKLLGTRVAAEDRAHFMAIVVTAMSQVIAHQARKRLAAKRGGGRVRVHVDLDTLWAPNRRWRDEEIVVVEPWLEKLEAIHTGWATAVRLRYLHEMDWDPVAESMSKPRTTVQRWVAMGCQWLRQAMTPNSGN